MAGLGKTAGGIGAGLNVASGRFLAGPAYAANARPALLTLVSIRLNSDLFAATAR